MFITIFYSSIIGAFGLIFGSFFSVVIDRCLREESVIFPRSHCVHCNTPLKVNDLIPLFSYLILRGACRYCRNKIPPVNPIVECLTATSFILAFLLTPVISDFLIGCGLFSLLIIVTVTDLQSMVIPNKVIISFAIYFLIIRIIYSNWHMLGQDILGCVFGLLCPLFVWMMYPDGMGWGDIKLFGLLGFVLGPHQIFTSILLACAIGIVSFLCLSLGKKFLNVRFYPLIRQPHNRLTEHHITRTLIPFAPFISIGALMAFLLGLCS